MNIRNSIKFKRPVDVLPDDLLVITINSPGNRQEFREKIGRKMTIDTVVTLNARDELGFVQAHGLVLGKAE